MKTSGNTLFADKKKSPLLVGTIGAGLTFAGTSALILGAPKFSNWLFTWEYDYTDNGFEHMSVRERLAFAAVLSVVLGAVGYVKTDRRNRDIDLAVRIEANAASIPKKADPKPFTDALTAPAETHTQQAAMDNASAGMAAPLPR